MQPFKILDRRAFLKLVGAGAAAVVLGGEGAPPARAGTPPRDEGFVPDLEIALTGDPNALSKPKNSWVGPILRLRRGTKLRVYFINELPEPSIIHWHGMYIPSNMDGHPMDAVGQGQVYVYEYEILNRAGTYWFHPHPFPRTAAQIYQGLTGVMLISDEEEDAASLPRGDFDLTMVLQDRTFDATNRMEYSPDRLARLNGLFGDEVLVNGHRKALFKVATRAYRFRLLNVSNSRVYKLAWEDGTKLTVIGTDGGLLQNPVERDYVMLGPAERVDLWVDFSRRKRGTVMELRSLPWSQMPASMAMGMMPMDVGAEFVPNGGEMSVLRVKVARGSKIRKKLKKRLSTVPRLKLEDSVNAGNARPVTLTKGEEQWLINGRTFDPEAIAEDEVVRLNTQEVWKLVNEPIPEEGNNHMGMAHLIHIHGLQFQVLDREILPDYQAAWDTVKDGYVDEGWKDTTLMMPGMRTRLLMRFEPFAGMYMLHCHMLEHEDNGMMRNFMVEE
jgi:FtsP/CotA-like multicopper oxidase with cupredoxin domain